MGGLERYEFLYNYVIQKAEEPAKKLKQVKEKFVKYESPKARAITLADSDPLSGNYITAHDLSDYRRSSFNLTLLPEIELQSDIIAKEVYGLSECL